jgi:hypothetical protein
MICYNYPKNSVAENIQVFVAFHFILQTKVIYMKNKYATKIPEYTFSRETEDMGSQQTEHPRPSRRVIQNIIRYSQSFTVNSSKHLGMLHLHTN